MAHNTQVLPSWRDTATRQTIIDFVEAVSTGPDALPAPERIAVFDNDGTLWTEKPMPTQLHFIVQQWAEELKTKPELAEHQPYRAVATGELDWIGGAVDKHYAGDDSDLHTLVGAIISVTAGMSVREYEEIVATFYREAKHLTRGSAYSQAVYTPMVELLGYLEANGFTNYIVSGGDRDFMRPMTQDFYGIPPERVIGSAYGLEYDADTNDVRYANSFSFLDDGPEKPIRIWTRIGRRPILACGNSNGDLPMLRFVQKHPRSLSLLVHHDDDTRDDPPYDKGAENALAAVGESGFTRVSVKDDWAGIFPLDAA
ncbi:haloacid dehalogenase-like hydrolase [Leucobacter viscericola]|uniref:Haloacid dehalogenase-like hydrolase n=1 Tax=Leucobacter viscericola TaxID=2714935 RepID=A0A6G7XFU1_9MICO|nr:HAD family hydrolase [Leucobacter viscericola]QIK63336.1 haloacid dehalogenase-like hydrolase [Leucobacter viscericola]